MGNGVLPAREGLIAVETFEQSDIGGDRIGRGRLEGGAGDRDLAHPRADRGVQVEGPTESRGLDKAADPIEDIAGLQVRRALLEHLEHLGSCHVQGHQFGRMRQQGVEALARDRTGGDRHPVAHAGHEGDVGSGVLAHQIAHEHVERALGFVLAPDPVVGDGQNLIQPGPVGCVDLGHQRRDGGVRCDLVGPEIDQATVDAGDRPVRVDVDRKFPQRGVIGKRLGDPD